VVTRGDYNDNNILNNWTAICSLRAPSRAKSKRSLIPSGFWFLFVNSNICSFSQILLCFELSSLAGIQFSLFYIAQYHKLQICLRGHFTICTHTSSLSQDLTSIQEKLPKNRKKPFTGKKGKKSSGEQQRRIPPGWTEAIDVMWPEGIITELQHIQWIWQSVWIVCSRHGPQSRPPWSIRQMEVERRSGRGIRPSQVQWTLWDMKSQRLRG